MMRRGRRDKAGALGAILALSLASCGGAMERADREEPVPGRSPEGETAPGRVRPPRTLVAVTEDGRLVLLSSGGRVLREYPAVEKLELASRRLGGLSITPDGTTLYLAYHLSPCSARIVAVSLADGSTGEVAKGTAPAVSPDGRRLAYATWAGVSPCDPESRLVVRDLRTGKERDWETVTAVRTNVVHTSWGPDSRRLAVADEWEGAHVVRIIDTRTTRSYEEARLLRRPRPGRGPGEWRDPSYRGSRGTLAVVEGSVTSHRVRGVLAVDPETGRVLGTILKANVVALDFDASGRHLLYVVLDPRTGERTLFRRSGDETVEVGGGYVAAAW